MLTFSPLLLLIPYVLFIVIHIFLSLVNVMHIFRTGTASFTSFLFTSVFLVYTLVVIGVTWNILGPFLMQPSVSFDFNSLFSPSAAFNFNG